MLVFIDESGDAGFKVGKGSTRNFVVACVIFEDRLDAEETSLEIKKLRRDMGKTERYEFKFSRSDHETRKRFLERIRRCKFKYRAVVMDKGRIYGKGLRSSKESFHRYTMKMLLKYSLGNIQNATLYVDGSGDRQFKRDTNKYLTREVNEEEQRIKDIKFRNSRNNQLLQLADMVAGAVNWSYREDKKDAGYYRDLIRKREDNVWDFGL